MVAMIAFVRAFAQVLFIYGNDESSVNDNFIARIRSHHLTG